MKTSNIDALRLIVCVIGLLFLLPALASSSPLSPTIFAPGVISGPNHEAAPAFTPDGKTVYFQRSSVRGGTILVSHLAHGRWSKPEIAPFSGAWNDIEPAMAPDGSFLVFISNRPGVPGGEAIHGTYNGSSQDGGNMWRVERHGAGWGEPVRLPDTINRSTTIFAPAVVADGSVYFMDAYGEKPRFRLYRSQFKGGTYEPAQPLEFSDGTTTDVDPTVAPDESFMIFGSGRPPAAKSIDLFIVRRQGSGWGSPVHLGEELNTPGSDAEPRLSPDLKTLYFSSERTVPIGYPRSLDQARQDLERTQSWDNGQYNIWYVPVAALPQVAD